MDDMYTYICVDTEMLKNKKVIDKELTKILKIFQQETPGLIKELRRTTKHSEAN